MRLSRPALFAPFATGGFSAVFFLQVMEAIGVKNLPLDTGD